MIDKGRERKNYTQSGRLRYVKNLRNVPVEYFLKETKINVFSIIRKKMNNLKILFKELETNGSLV